MEAIDISNVANAIKWVIGEQSPKSSGVSKMRDIISGSSFAQVSLIINNCDSILPIDSVEVKISRGMYRQSESEYSINGLSCRLYDIKGLCKGVNFTDYLNKLLSVGEIANL